MPYKKNVQNVNLQRLKRMGKDEGYRHTNVKYPELNIPNTTNSLDGFFNTLKSKLNVHRGLNRQRAKKVIVELLKGKKKSK